MKFIVNAPRFFVCFLIFVIFSNATSQTYFLDKSTASNNSKTLNFTSGIRSIYHDSKGHYWFGSHNQGVALFDGKQFTYFTVENGLSHNQVRSIQEADDGSIWFGTGQGVSRFKNNEMNSYLLDKGVKNAIASYPGVVNKSQNDYLWFNAGTKSGIYRLNNGGLNYLAFPVEKDNHAFQPCATTDHHYSSNGDLWIATYTAVFKYNGLSFMMIDDKLLGYKVPSLHVRSILEDSKGRVWIGNNGIGVLLKEGDSISHFSDDKGLIHGKSTRNGSPSPEGTLEHVFSIEEDSLGNIWFGDRDTGAWMYDGEKMINFDKKDGLSNNFAQIIYKDKHGGLWLGLADGGVYLFNGESFERKFVTK
ncbi:MAG: two-component regulator propeller domain-containing protein [Marinicellaceae bacterium]